MATEYKKITDVDTFDSNSTTESIGSILGITQDSGGARV